MKKCPRCKSQMIKSHSEKMICRACGYVTRDLEVARDNQQFQQRHNFSKKITIIRNMSDPTKVATNPGLGKHYLSCFQTLLRSTANYLSKSNKQFIGIQTQARQIWLNYCGLVVRCGADVSGVFTKLLKTRTKQSQIEEKYQQQQQPKHQQKKQQQEPHTRLGQLAESGRGRGKKRNLSRQKKLTCKSKARAYYKQIQLQQKDGISVGEQRALFFQYICSDLWQLPDIDGFTVEYIGNKYAELLVREIYSGLSGGYGVAEAKGRPFKVTNKQLQHLSSMRKLNVKDRKQIILFLLLEDMLRQWSTQISMENEHSLSDLLLLYESEENIQKKSLITATIQQLKKEVEASYQSQTETKQSLPQLSFNLLYAILYLATLTSCNTLSIHDIVVLASKSALELEYEGRKIDGDEKVCTIKIRATAITLLKLLQMNCQPTTATLSKWVEKYAKVCGLAHRLDQLIRLAETLHHGLQKQEHTHIVNSFVEQDTIAKSIIAIFIKLQQGFQNYPYLSRIPQSLINRLRVHNGAGNTQNYITFLESLPVHESLSIARVLENLQQQYGSHSERNRDLKQKLPSINYSSLSYLTLAQLKTLTKRTVNLQINLAKAKLSQHHKKWVAFGAKEKTAIKLSKLLRKQLQVAIKQESSGEFRCQDLDLPSSNYEFFYEYTLNIRHAGRNLFVLLAEKLSAAECPIPSLYGWIEALERVMINFEN